MDITINKNEEVKNEIKSTVVDFLNKTEIPYSMIEADGKELLCLDLNCGRQIYDNKPYYTPISVLTSDKNVCKIYPYEIMYVAIENRESVLHLINERNIKTNYNISHWNETLPADCFARPHNSFIVNLNYVTEVTRNFVYLKYNDFTDSVYTSQRKVAKFKKIFLYFKK